MLICNSWIYNFNDLKRQLLPEDYKFYTKTDVEVIINLYEEYPEECVKFLYSVFAFAIWDKKRKRLSLVRNRLVMQPLCYTLPKSGIVFPSDYKIYKDILPLNQTSWIIYQDDKILINFYWWLKFDDELYKINTSATVYFYLDNPYNKLNKTRFIVEKLKTRYTKHIVESNVIRILPDIVKSFSRLFADSFLVVNFIIPQIVYQCCKIVLTGLGGNELFCIYFKYLVIKLSKYFPKIKIPDEILDSIPETYSSDNYLGRLKIFITSLKFNSDIERYFCYINLLI